jgi:Zn-finger nucleic acid-binding protein
MAERQGVEIDYCPACRGIWLDRGELDKLLDRAADVFGNGTAPEPVDLAPLHAKIGQLALENDFLESALTKAGLLSAKR